MENISNVIVSTLVGVLFWWWIFDRWWCCCRVFNSDLRGIFQPEESWSDISEAKWGENIAT